MKPWQIVLLAGSGVLIAAGAVCFFAFGLWQGFIPICVGVAGMCALGITMMDRGNP
jgi:hypothetical protein